MKTNIIKFSPSHFLHSQLITEHNNTAISEAPETKVLGVKIDNHLNWRCHIDCKKGKAIPLQAWTGPEGSRRLRLPDFKTIDT